MIALTDITEALDSRQQFLEAKHLQAIGLLASGVAHGELGVGRMMENDQFIAWGKPGGGEGNGLTAPFDGQPTSVTMMFLFG